MKKNFLFTSKRLGFRNWIGQDIEAMGAISADPKVMEYFPATNTLEETAEFIERMQQLFNEKRFCYFATIELASNCCIGFIGFSIPTFEASFTPFIDIGWRLSSQHWGHGYATEGALRCLEYGFKELNFKTVKAIAPKVNQKSIQVMKKIGMTKVLEFNHPRLKGNKQLEKCVCYEISRS